jgi:ATP-dependent exoDNAse (exonuclease V) beta subunit|tara:strand:+ start:87 stop:866 length:780 start_codon:yes stop_codon:yes gene_type:complete
MSKNHISYSEFKMWSECAWKHRLKYVDNISSFSGNEYTAFGTAIHDVCEKSVLGALSGPRHAQLFFENAFNKQLEKLSEDHEKKDSLIKDMIIQGNNLIPEIIPNLKKYFGKFKVISAEEKLYEPIANQEKLNFKGFVDLVLQTEDGKYHIIDWKTCTWGWDARKKTNKLIVYQLILYKYYFAKKYGVELKDIETHFALLKRTAKKNNVEFFKVTSGKKRTENALKALDTSLYYINRKFAIKNRLSCKYCEFYKTEHCR